MENLQEQMEALAATVAALRSRQQAVEARLGLWRCLAGVAVVVSLLILPLQSGKAQGPGSSLPDRVAALESQVATLTTKLARVSVANGGADLYINGANLHVVNGMGTTTTTNGLGNLIIGYNALRGSGNVRAGSHCLILGDENNYSSFGGLVAGHDNAILADYASVSGGGGNTASAFASSVSGGGSNTASNNGASVSGGAGNTASGVFSSVSGGLLHSASGFDNWAAGSCFSCLN